MSLVATVDTTAAVWVDGKERRVKVKAGDPIPQTNPVDQAIARVLLDAGHAEHAPDELVEPEPQPETPARRRPRKES
jgi:hypothetical protein